MKKSREEERKRRTVPKPENSPSTQPSTSRAPTKKKLEKANTDGTTFWNKQDNLEQFFREIMSVSKCVDLCEELFPFLDESPILVRKEDEEMDEKLYVCPEISDEILTKCEWLRKIQDYIMIVHESDPILAAVLTLKSLNTKEKADQCISIIMRYLRNIVEHPENEKYRHIRCLNPIVEGKVLNTEGALLFFGTIGFELESEDESAESYLTFHGNHCHLREVIKILKNVKGFELSVFGGAEEEDRGRTCTDGSREDDKFYKLTSTDLKKNQKLRALEIERESTLRTKSTREKERQLVPKSKITKIRIRTPESIVESSFEITDKLLQVYQYIDNNVAEGRKYTLMMPPATPFKDSDVEKSLAELQLFPAVLLTLKWLQPDKKHIKGKK